MLYAVCLIDAPRCVDLRLALSCHATLFSLPSFFAIAAAAAAFTLQRYAMALPLLPLLRYAADYVIDIAAARCYASAAAR